MIEEDKIQENKRFKSRKRSRNMLEDKKKRFKLGSVFLYTLFTLVFTVVSAPFILLYGPFENAKKTFVGTAIESMHYQWLATMFLSQDKIDEILGNNVIEEESIEENEEQDSSFIEIPKRKDNTIELQEISDENEKFKGYVLIIKDPTRVKIGVSSKLGQEGETVSQIAERYDAVAAINGGYFTDEVGTEKWTSNGGIPIGFLMSEGTIKQNVDPNDRQSILAITKEGRLLVGETTTAELLGNKENDKDVVVEAMTYEVTLIKNGKLCNVRNEGTAPRTLIGQKEDGSIVMVVLDSVMPGNRICATLSEAQKLMSDLGCYNAVNLDGGKSTTMYLNGEVINTPSYVLGERQISAGFIVK